MWPTVLTVSSLLVIAFAEMLTPELGRDFSDGQSLGYKVIYGDEDIFLLNEVVQDFEKTADKGKIRLNESIKALPAQDVKCLMSVDRYCSKEMGQMKGVLIQALKEDCVHCTEKQKDDAGKVIASMMAHDPVAWKLFLTRYNGLQKVERILGAESGRFFRRAALQVSDDKKPRKRETFRFREIGPAEEIDNSRNRDALPDVRVRVKRYPLEKLP